MPDIKVKKPHSTQGTKGPDIQARIEGGTPLSLVKDAPKNAPRAGPALDRAREVIRGGWSKEQSAIRQGFRDGTAGFWRERQAAQARRNPDGSIRAVDRERLSRTADEAAKWGAKKAAQVINAGVKNAVVRDLRAQLWALRKMGIPPPLKGDLDGIVNKARHAALNSKFPGTNLSSKDRLAHLQQQAAARFGKVIDAKGVKDVTKAMQDVRHGLHNPKPGRSRGSGGDISKKIERIRRTEQSRAMRDATLELGRKVEVSFAYWRLAGNHPWYGGNEICEKLAIATGPDVQAALDELGVKGVYDLDGLFLLDSYPDIPHPNCMCQPELWHPKEALKSVDLDKLTRKGVLPENLQTMSMVPSAMTATANRFANEIGVTPGLTRDMVSTLGADGTAAVIAAKLRPSSRIAALNALQKMRGTLTPSIQKSLAAAREKRDALVKSIESNEVLAQTTKASQVAKIQDAFKSELKQAASTVSMMQALEGALRNKTGQVTVFSSKSTEPHMLAYHLRAMGISAHPDNYTLVKQGGVVSARINVEALAQVKLQKAYRSTKAVDAVKRQELLRDPRGLQATIPWHKGSFLEGRPIVIRAEQQAGIRFIEEAKSVLLHFGAGLGKTPTVISSIADLHHQGKIEAGCISTPAALRTQMVQEVMSFDKSGKVVLYVSPSDVGSTKKALVAQIRDVVYAKVPHKLVYKDRRGNVLDKPTQKALKEMDPKERAWIEGRVFKVGDPKKVPGDYIAKLEAEIAARRERLEVKGSSKDPEVMAKRFAEDALRGVLYTVMSHGDLGRSAVAAKDRFDYVAIDEIHQMTSQAASGGSEKSRQLKELVGGKLKYRVALTGTASKNNIGEFHDIASWLYPGRFGDKAEFMEQFKSIPLATDVLHESMHKYFRRLIADFTFTRHSPVEAKLHNAFKDKHPDVTHTDRLSDGSKVTKVVKGSDRSAAEKSEYLRDVKMTDKQAARARQIEEQFEIARANFDKSSVKQRSGWRRKQNEVKGILKDAIKRYPVMAEFSDHPQLGRKLRDAGVHPNEAKAIVDARRQATELTRLVAPENWRDTQHHRNLHGGPWNQNAKIQEVLRLTGKDGPLAGRRPIIHVEQLESLEEIRAALRAAGKSVAVYEGSMNNSQRIETLKQWSDRRHDVLIVTRAGSTGLNLQDVSTGTIHFDTPYTWAEYAQREARNWRTGQQHEVHSYTLSHGDSVTDSRRLELMQQKGKVLAAIDELSAVNDKRNPLAVLNASRRRRFKPVEEEAASKGREAANKLAHELAVELGLAEAKINAPINGHTPPVALVPLAQRQDAKAKE